MNSIVKFLYTNFQGFTHNLIVVLPFLHNLLSTLALNSFKTSDGNFLGKLNGHKMFFRPYYVGFFLKDEYEPDVTKIFLNEIHEGDIVIDIGANIGYFTLLAARLVGEKGKVFAFEPEPNNYDLLLKNIEINNYKNVIPIQKAVSNENKTTKLFLRQDSSMNSLLEGFNANPSIGDISIDTVTIDNFFKDNPLKSKIKLIKMDIEGAEMQAILGMLDLIKENKELVIITEFNPSFIRKSGFEPQDFLSKINEFGFLCKIISESNDLELNKLEIDNIESHVNLVCYNQSNYDL